MNDGNDRNLFFAGVVGIITLTIVTIVIIASGAGLFIGGVMLVCITIGAILVTAARSHIRVREMETAVVFSHLTDSFSRFLPEGQHLIKPTEYIYDTIITAPRSVGGHCSHVHTVDGIEISVDWQITVAVDTETIPENLRSRIARALPKFKEKMVRKHGNHCVRLLINDYSVQAILDRGSRPRLERQLRSQMVQRMPRYGLQVYKVIIKEINLPQSVKNAHENALTREVTLMSKAREMTQIANLIYGMPESDRLWLTRLLQTYIMGENGVNLVMPHTAYGPPNYPQYAPPQGTQPGNSPHQPGNNQIRPQANSNPLWATGGVPDGIYGELPKH